ncbi:NAD(P)-dependent oxidoreductase [Rhizobium sp. P38BS-XIX]|uniref:NAD(P)-binding domain-containing protein n=1 Tax=Rhizobium sp. P38BS-XIX TaxID=2726740 RepID=UPI00145780E0|nr:NAD(P)-dependent oxidoreductase [Rhizobium sp. P38BS-XIX]
MSASVRKRVAFLGTGLMGAPMVKRLLGAGFAVSVWNRSHEKASHLAIDGAVVSTSAADAVRNADVVFAMLTNEQAFDELFFADVTIIEALRAGAVVVEGSSVLPEASRRHAERLRKHGVQYLDAPVSGGVAGAAAGTLAIMVGGDAPTFLRLADVFAPLGRATHVGPTGSGQLAKLGNQQIVAVTIGAVAEAMLLVQRGGGDPAAFRAAIRGGFAESRILELHGQRMIERNFEPGGTSANQLKDLNNILSTAVELGLALPLTAAVQKQFAAFVQEGGADRDHSALLVHLEGRNSDGKGRT